MGEPTSPARMADSLTVELNGEPTTKGPDPDRLVDHDGEVAAHEARLDGR